MSCARSLPSPSKTVVLCAREIRFAITHAHFFTEVDVHRLQNVEKNNKRLKGTNPTLAGRRHTFERVRQLWSEKKGAWCALDFEAWERDHTAITEFGWSTIAWQDGQMIEDRGHLTVKEHRGYRNGQYVPERREVGVSISVKLHALTHLSSSITDSAKVSRSQRHSSSATFESL
jgi:hypothetical protein